MKTREDSKNIRRSSFFIAHSFYYGYFDLNLGRSIFPFISITISVFGNFLFRGIHDIKIQCLSSSILTCYFSIDFSNRRLTLREMKTKNAFDSRDLELIGVYFTFQSYQNAESICRFFLSSYII